MHNTLTQGLSCSFCQEQRKIAPSKQPLLRFGEIVVCGICGSMLHHDRAASQFRDIEVPEEIAGLLHCLVLQHPLTIDLEVSPPRSYTELRYGQHVQQFQVKLHKRQFETQASYGRIVQQYNDLPRLFLTIHWFDLSNRTGPLASLLNEQFQEPRVEKLHDNAPASIKKLVKLFAQQGFAVTEWKGASGNGLHHVRLELMLPSENTTRVFRTQIEWDRLLSETTPTP